MSEFWKSVFSKEGCQSWGRIAATVTLLLGMAWVTRLVLLITFPDQYDKLSAIAIFLGAVIGSVATLYSISKGLDTYQHIKENRDDNKTEVAKQKINEDKG